MFSFPKGYLLYFAKIKHVNAYFRNWNRELKSYSKWAEFI